MAEPTLRNGHPFSRDRLETLLRERFFFAPAFKIYGGITGFYDYGPPGAALQANILDLWRKHFIVEEDMLELDTTTITAAAVLETSGHVAKFTDWMTKDILNPANIYRADHLVESVLEGRLKSHSWACENDTSSTTVSSTATGGQIVVDVKGNRQLAAAAVKLDDATVAEYKSVLARIDNFTGAELGALIRQHNIKAPETGNDLEEPQEFNLMFDASIGPTGQVKGFLRPETAQGHFINFGRLLDFNNGRVPFASAQIGRAYRNEISPRQGLLRVREFTMAEIEHYVDPLRKDHSRFGEVGDVELQLLPKDVQTAGRGDLLTMTIREAVAKRIVDNSTLGYFLARIHLFLLKVGIDPARLRFRQHMPNEMAHYAADCWDAEVLSSYGWIECVGCADRSAYDLTVHSQATKEKLVVREHLREAKVVEKVVANADMKVVGQRFKPNGKKIKDALSHMDEEELKHLSEELNTNSSAPLKLSTGEIVLLTPDCLTIECKTFKESVREFTPNVIEPSFGVGRILYSVLEHSYWCRAESAQRGVLSLRPLVAPIKCLIVPISSREEFRPLISQVSQKFRKAGISCRIDDSNASIGKRYARNDELGTPFSVTIDFASLQNDSMTLRERDTTNQLIGVTNDVVEVVCDLCHDIISWQQACTRLTAYSGQQALGSDV